MLSRKLLGSSNVTPLDRKILYAWGDNNASEFYLGNRPLGFPSTYDMTPVGTDYYRVNQASFSDDLQVSEENIFNSLPKEVDGNGVLVLDAGRQLHTFGGANSEATLNLSLQTQQLFEQSWSQIEAGYEKVFAINSDGILFAAGTERARTQTNVGLHGTGEISNKNVYVQVGTSSWSQISCSDDHALAITTDGKLFAWGRNNVGQLGLGIDSTSLTKISYPVQVGTLSWAQVSAGSGGISAGITTDGKLFTWGYNAFGQLGTNSILNFNYPNQIGVLESWSQVSCGRVHMAAIRADGRLFTWGNNANGQLGDNTVIARSSPVSIGTSSWTQVLAGKFHTHAIRLGGNLFGVGAGNGGVGDGLLAGRSSPVQIGSRTYSYITTSKNGATFDGELFAGISNRQLFLWGDSRSNTISAFSSSLVTYSSPTFVRSNVDKVSVSKNFVLALNTVDPELDVWGQVATTITTGILTGRGFTPFIGSFPSVQRIQFGQNQAVTVEHPWIDTTIQRYSSDKWKKISISNETAAGIKLDGTLWRWGRGVNPGTLTTLYYDSPTLISTPGKKWADVSVGDSYILVIQDNGLLHGIGNNTVGQLGTDNINLISQVTQIGTDSWYQVSTKNGRSIGIKSNRTLWGWGDNTIHYFNPNTTPNPLNVTSWKQISYGGQLVSAGYDQFIDAFAVAISGDGRLFTWGDNFIGQLGTGDRVSTQSPVQIGTSSWTQVSAGGAYVLAIRADNKLFSWGNNGNGQLGNNNRLSRSSPVQVGSSSWAMVSAGKLHSGAITSDGRLFTWGNNTVGELGLNNVQSRSSPVQVGTSSWTQVSLAELVSAGIDINGGLYTWGTNTNGQLGGGLNPLVTARTEAPLKIGNSSWTQVSSGAGHKAAIDINGRLFTWGLNSSGQLGDNTRITRSSFVLIGSSSWTFVSAALAKSSAITSDGRLFTWGSNFYGNLAQNDLINRSSPTLVSAAFSPSQLVSLSEYNGGAISESGQLQTWGYGGRATFGQGNPIGAPGGLNRSSPVTITSVLTPLKLNAPAQIGSLSWTQVSIGRSHVAGIQAGTQRLYVWGSNTFGQVGDNTRTFRSSPTFVDFPSVVPFLSYDSWVQVGVGDNHTVAIGQFGSLWAWGDNTYKQLGFRNTEAPPQLFSWKQLAGEGTVFGIRSDGLLFSWGDSNLYGQLGQGDTIIRNYPTQIGTSSWTQVSASEFNCGAINIDGKLFTWGLNNSGQLGLGNRINRSSPVQVGTSSWIQVTGNGGTMSAITSDKRLFTWGAGSFGLTGHNDRIDRSSPVQVGTSSWMFVNSSGPITATFVVAIRHGGSLFSWGFNFDGQLGDGTTISRSSPVQIGTSSWSQVSAGLSHTAAINALGKLFTWGANFTGQLGSNTTLSRSSPVQIGTSSWTQILAYRNSTIGITTAKTLFAWGANLTGQLGDGTLINRSAPVQIYGSSGYLWSKIDKGLFGNDLGFYISPDIPNSPDAPYFYTSSNTSLNLVTNGEVNIALHRSSPAFLGSGAWRDVVAGPRSTYVMKLNT